MQAARARADETLSGASLDNGDIDACQGKFTRQHQARRTASGDHHRMFGHRFSGSGWQLCGMTPVLQQAPGCAIYW